MATKTKVIFPILFLLIAVPAGIVFYLYSSYRKAAYEGYGDPTKTIDFIIEQGESTDEIAADLLEKGLITNETFFKLYLRQNDVASTIQAGSFTVPNNLSIEKLVEILQKAEFPDIWVTIPEGLMAKEIAEMLANAFATYPESSFDKETFLSAVTTPALPEGYKSPAPEGKGLEGYLFPDTYRFPPDATAEYVLLTMVSTFNEKLIIPNQKDIEASSLTVDEIVILASILERETRQAHDRPKVADILLRRLEAGWALEVDATLLYHFGDWQHVITYQDLQLDTPYNTRKYQGFPPTPIANPGAQSFEAVLNPEPNEYWFYINDKEGTLHYAKTLAEHNQNIATYLQ